MAVIIAKTILVFLNILTVEDIRPTKPDIPINKNVEKDINVGKLLIDTNNTETICATKQEINVFLFIIIKLLIIDTDSLNNTLSI